MPAGLVIAAIGIGVSLYQGAKASKDRKEAVEAIENYERQDVTNPYLALDRYPTQAVQLQKEANERELAANVSLAARSGRGLSIMPQASAVYSRRSRELYGELEKYQYERDLLIAGGEVSKQAIQERREEGDIAGLGNLYATASQDMNNAMVAAGNSLAIGAEAYAANPDGLSGMFNGASSRRTPNMTGVQSNKASLEGVGARTELAYGNIADNKIDYYNSQAYN